MSHLTKAERSAAARKGWITRRSNPLRSQDFTPKARGVLSRVMRDAYLRNKGEEPPERRMRFNPVTNPLAYVVQTRDSIKKSWENWSSHSDVYDAQIEEHKAGQAHRYTRIVRKSMRFNPGRGFSSRDKVYAGDVRNGYEFVRYIPYTRMLPGVIYGDSYSLYNTGHDVIRFLGYSGMEKKYGRGVLDLLALEKFSVLMVYPHSKG